MTSYKLSVGYMSNSSPDRETEWRGLCVIAASITLKELQREYSKFETVTSCGCGTQLSEMLERYEERNDLTVFVREKDKEIVQYASGSCSCRDMKEGLRRAFCRLVIQGAHQQRIEVNLIVA